MVPSAWQFSVLSCSRTAEPGPGRMGMEGGAGPTYNHARSLIPRWSEPLGLDHIAPSQLSRLLGEQGFEFLGGSVAEG